MSSSRRSRRGGICHQWQRTGTCRYGNACKFTHDGQSRIAGTRSNPPRASIKASDSDMTRYVKHLKVIQADRIGSELQKSSGMWLRCWQSQDKLGADIITSMLEVLARLPGSASVDPPPVESFENAASQFLAKKATKNESDGAVLTAVKTVRDAIVRCLEFDWPCSREAVKGALGKIIIDAESKLRKQCTDHRPVSGQLLEMLDDLECSWRIKLARSKSNSSSSADAGAALGDDLDASHYEHWEKASVKWLSTPEFFAPSKCPTMKAGNAGVYDSAEDYLSIIHRLWVAMTFSEGHAAFAPHCRSRNASGFGCGSALWPISESSDASRNMNCRSKHCRKPVEYCCRIRGHDALCADCASRSIDAHMGGPGPGGSTHIYDAKVKNIETDGKIYLVDFQSRNPPPKPIHWRSTKRLSPPNLVGLVRLQSKGASLEPSDRIVWAEIVYHGFSRDEDRKRQSGNIALNLSSVVDFDPEYFEENQRVAIIDCMCFVPEWIPVLKAITGQRNSKLPFDNGRHLNLCVSEPITKARSVMQERTIESVTSAPKRQLIEELVANSQLEPICEIRRDSTLRNSLIGRLEQLVVSTTLDPMQLVSFCDALLNPVHLTQGPPGTGKSYLGVVLVRSLMIIRELWLKKSKSVVASPILVLSYKNHAIDEFLVDLAKAEPMLSGRKMIRIGGQCKDTRLSAFAEKSVYHADPLVRSSQKLVDNLESLKESVQFTFDRDVCSFLSYRDQIFSGEDARSRHKASREATGRLMESIIRCQFIKDFIENISNNGESCSLLPSEILSKLQFLSVDRNGEPSQEIQQVMYTRDGSKSLSVLVEGFSHYGNKHWGDIVMQWLSNKKPRPKCAFVECDNLALSPELLLCDDHSCQYITSKQGRCAKRCIDDGIIFCVDHICIMDECTSSRLPNGQTLCAVHACRQCVSSGIVAQLATDEPPRNVCEDHPLCSFLSCLEPCCSKDSIYCSEHNILKCLSTTKRGRPCKGTPISRLIPFCKDHKHQVRSLLNDSFSAATVNPYQKSESKKVELSQTRCSAVKRKGGQCNGICIPRSPYCYDHSMNDDKNSIHEAKKGPSIINPCDDTSNDEVDDDKEEEFQLLKNYMTDNHDQTLSRGEGSDFDEEEENSIVHDESNESLVESDEDNEGENLQHLRDVFEVDEPEETLLVELVNDLEASEINVTDDSNRDPFDRLMSDPNNWTWELSLDERWRACQALMEELGAMMTSVSVIMKKSVIEARREYQEEIVRAKARVYENKAVIGGTMVGCISRLDSIRKTRPFAVICEEASEVLEPLLFSCLAESTLKLEMVGDHRQLQPSVMDRYEFELINRVNISLFQRLIEAPEGHTVPTTVLSIQRRMRKNICDLTRAFYADITDIVDHESCGTQVVGLRNKHQNNSMVTASSTRGREIPGVGPHVFLWTHGGKQQRSQIGVSRMNQCEVDMTCSLASYLVECGVPRSSIAILTPYKGQLMAIRKTMINSSRPRSLKLLPKDPEQDSIRISTVDRFQGDEEDIIICSLVVDQNSKTGFVKLVNRMIVLLSRARLGLYILANQGYFDSQGLPSHWEKTLQLLQNGAEKDSSGADDREKNETYLGERCGFELPLCCPVHRGITKKVSDPNALRPNFCTETCKSTLDCGHPCSLPCHWSTRDKHNKRCVVELESPCSRHAKKIKCHDAFYKVGVSCYYTEVMKYYKCGYMVDLELKCKHVVRMPCFEENQISSGVRSEPLCNEPSPIPYIFPSCGHSIKATCAELEQFISDPQSIKCKQTIIYHANCGHHHQMACWKQPSDASLFSCQELVDFKLPRCGHQQKIQCKEAQLLESWKGKSCEEIGLVNEGVTYGPVDYPCKMSVKLVQPCGHFRTLPCEKAFAEAPSVTPCQELVSALHPNCGHTCNLPCRVFNNLQQRGIHAPGNCIAEFNEGTTISPSSRTAVAGLPRCTEQVKLVRKCGHSNFIDCSDIGKPVSSCREKTTVVSPLCGHPVNIPCISNGKIDQMSAETADLLKKMHQSRNIPQDDKLSFDLSKLPREAKKALASCRQSLQLTLPCGHNSQVNCSALIDVLQGKFPICEAEVDVSLECGHICRATCLEKYQHQRKEKILHCQSKKQQKCWNFDKCQSLLEVDCNFHGTAACCRKSEWLCPSFAHCFEFNQCSSQVPLDCAQCFIDNILQTINEPMMFVGSEDLRRGLSSLRKDCISIIEPDLKKYHRREADLLQKYQDTIHDSPDIWKEPLHQPRRIPIFRILAEKRHKMADSFDPRQFLKKEKSLFGIMTKQLSAKNIRKIVTQGKVLTLLIGYASVAKTKVQPPSQPISKKQKKALDFVLKHQADGYDSVVFSDGNGLETIVVWDPYPIVAMYRLHLNEEDMEHLAKGIEKMPNPSLDPISLRFSDAPEGHLVISKNVDTVHDGENDSDDDDDSCDSLDPKISLQLEGTALKGLGVDTHWVGGMCSHGLLPDTMEKNLVEKMQFVNSDAQPFAAMKLLRTLLAELSDKLPLLHLLMAAEALLHSTTDSQKHMDNYLSCIRESQTRVHPWALIVAARLDPQSFDPLLSLYIELFPIQEKYLSKEELAHLKQTEDHSTNEAEEKGSHDVLLERWSKLKDQYPGEVKSKATEDLLALVGLRKVKAEVISLWKTALQLKRMDEDTRSKNQITTNYCFVGNPCNFVCKLNHFQVCRLFAEILRDSGLRSSNKFSETTAQHVKDEGSDKFRQLVKNALGGILFIDEAYDLNPVGDTVGRPIVNELLTVCENDRDKISIVLAGYEDDFEKKFFAYNVGLKSRFKVLVFEDFDETELRQIWNSMRQEKKWSEEKDVSLVAAKRLFRASGRKGFGNARAVRQLLESATKAAMTRLGDDFSMDQMSLMIEDVIGEDPRLANEKLQRVLASINEKIGWKKVKERVKELIDLCGVNYKRELLGKPPLELFLNRMFLGNPGTGKTTCAKLYGSLLRELGFLSNGEVVVKTASDFIGQYTGQSQTKTVDILNSAKGKVLVIDEAYALDAGSTPGSNANAFGKQVLDTIVEKVQGGPSDDIAVLLLGYEDQMIRMISESNPGLARRFPKEHAFYFDDYEDSELLAILDFNIKKQDVSATMDFREKALNILQIQRKQTNFGNAGAVELLLKGAMQRASQKFASDQNSSFTLGSDDIVDPGSSRAEKNSNPFDELDKLYRMEKIKKKLQKMKMNWEVARRDGSDEPEIGHMVFLGNPGTGKTTVARIMSDILFSLALKPSNVFVETSGLELTGQYVGQTKTKVADHLKKAKGGVLFIDEAYSLGKGPFEKEACDTLVAAMTSEEFSDVLVVIAGYSAEINEMLNSNEGLKSRFTNFFEFPDWEVDDCLAFFGMCAQRESFEVDSDARGEIRDGCRRLKQLKGWGNGRDVKRLFTQSKENRAERVYNKSQLEKKIERSDAKGAINSMLQARIGKLSDPEEDPLAGIDKLFRMEDIKAKILKLQKTWSVERSEGNDNPTIGHFCFTGSPGCGKTTVARAIAKVLFGLELKASDKIVETSALELTGEYVGHTKKKVERQLQDAKGGVLFIDEAYSFHGQFGQEAVDTLVAAMTSPDYADVLIVIAGYPVEIDEMFQKNPGLKSRFSHFFVFPDWTANDCAKFFLKCAKDDNYNDLGNEVLDTIHAGCQELIGFDGWANGRDVIQLWKESKANRAERLDGHPEKKKIILSQDVELAMESMIEARRPKTGRHRTKNPSICMDNPPVRSCAGDHDAPPAPPSQSNTDKSQPCTSNAGSRGSTHKATDKVDADDGADESDETASHDGSTKSNSGDDYDERDEGVSDEVWDELQASKENERKRLQEIAKLDKELKLARQAAKEARRRHEEELERIRKEKERDEQEKARKKAEEEEARRRELEQRRIREIEEKWQRLEEQRRKQEAIKRKLQTIIPCPAGFNWHKIVSGWRCGGGSHFVSDEELRRRYGVDL